MLMSGSDSIQVARGQESYDIDFDGIVKIFGGSRP